MVAHYLTDYHVSLERDENIVHHFDPPSEKRKVCLVNIIRAAAMLTKEQIQY